MNGTIVVRRIAATPARPAIEAWRIILGLLAPLDTAAWKELERVGGLVTAMIAAEAMRESPIVVYGVGSRLRVYCVYDDDAILGEDVTEDSLSWCPTDGDWAMSLPCPSDDLAWMEPALARITSRVTVRDLAEAAPAESEGQTRKSSDELGPVDVEAFLKP